MNRGTIFSLFLMQLFVPAFALGQVIFTEIMYDPKDADAGHEWVEIHNSGNTSVNLSGWKFFENSTNHSLAVISGEATLPAGLYAIIADDATKFGNDFPQFAGILFDSSFSLKNTGEPIVLKNKTLQTIDTVTYDVSIGASGDWNSLQKNSSGDWIAGVPTPGTGIPTLPNNTESTTTPPLSDNPVAAQSANNSNWPVEPQVFALAGKDKVVIVGASVIFDGKAYGLKKEPLENTRFLWNFGDGAIGEGKMVEHTYRHPGDYLVVMEAASGYFSGEDQLKVRAEPSPMVLSAITDGSEYFIELTNSSNSDIDISSWGLALGLPVATNTAQAGDKVFDIPKNTFVMGGKRIVFANDVTGLSVQAGSVPELRYPNGTLAYRYGDEKPNTETIPNNIRGAPVAGLAVPNPASEKNNAAAFIQTRDNQTGYENMAAANAASKNNYSKYIWFTGVGGISLVALLGIFLSRHYERPEDEIEKLAREIEIIE